jgi:hypothetical protein
MGDFGNLVGNQIGEAARCRRRTCWKVHGKSGCPIHVPRWTRWFPSKQTRVQ